MSKEFFAASSKYALISACPHLPLTKTLNYDVDLSILDVDLTNYVVVLTIHDVVLTLEPFLSPFTTAFTTFKKGASSL